MTTAGRVFEENRDSEQQCRICATLVDRHNAIHIFAEDGRRHYLQTKIRKYLYILVTSEDKLSKMVCPTCIKRLEGVHHFATMAYRTQEKLKLQLYEDSDDRISLEDSLDADNIQSSEEGSKKTEDLNLNRGLLHSALTKGNVEVLTECESLGLPDVQVRQNTPNTEEMEVKIDPMLFLQCGMDQSNSETSDLSDDEERKHKFHTTESPSLTHKKQETKVGDKKNTRDSKHNHVWSHLSREKRFDGKPTNNVLHVNADNNSVGNFVCPICNKRISTKGNLKVHLETHRPKGKYGCDICGRIFKTQSNLFRHKEYHGGVQYPCNVCGRVYPTNSTLRAHSITHSDLRPHACPLCDKTFKRNQDLKFHINQHTGARPYQCPYCPKAFASSGNCFSHRKRMHPREVHRDRQRAADLMR